MKRYFINLMLITVLSLGNSCSETINEEQLVLDAYQNYKTAILNDKGDEAIKYVDSRTLNYYERILATAIGADSAEVSSLPLMDKMMVLIVRHRISQEEIVMLDGRGLFVYAVKNGMIGKNSVADNTIGEVKITGDFASGQLLVNGRPTPLDFNFYKEGGEWKLDLTAVFEASTAAFTEIIANSGQSQDEYILTMLETLTGRKPERNIWHKIK